MSAANGSARSFFMEALSTAKEGDFEEADRLMSEGEAMLGEGHHAHGNLLSQEASGDKVKVDLLLVHAEEQTISAEAFKIMAGEMIEIYSRLK